MLSKTTIESAMAALRVCHESLGEPSAHFSVEVQRKHQAEIESALEELHRELVDAPPTVPQGMPESVREAIRKAEQLAEIASDWHLDEVEIDGEMVSIYDLRDEFKAALALLDSAGAE